MESLDWIAFALALVGTLSILMGVAWVAGAIRMQESFDHDYPTVDFGVDEEAMTGAPEQRLCFVLPGVVMNLNQTRKDAA